MIKQIRDKLKLDPTDEQLKEKYIKDFKRLNLMLFPDGNKCHVCLGKGYTSFNTETHQMVVCDCINRETMKQIIKRDLKDARN